MDVFVLRRCSMCNQVTNSKSLLDEYRREGIMRGRSIYNHLCRGPVREKQQAKIQQSLTNIFLNQLLNGICNYKAEKSENTPCILFHLCNMHDINYMQHNIIGYQCYNLCPICPLAKWKVSLLLDCHPSTEHHFLQSPHLSTLPILNSV